MNQKKFLFPVSGFTMIRNPTDIRRNDIIRRKHKEGQTLYLGIKFNTHNFKKLVCEGPLEEKLLVSLHSSGNVTKDIGIKEIHKIQGIWFNLKDISL